MATLQLNPRQEADAAIVGVVDANGNPATFDGAPTWVSSDPAIVDLRVADDGMSAIVGSLDAFGAATITVTGDGRHGPDVVPLTAVLSVLVTEPDVAVFDISVGAARPRA